MCRTGDGVGVGMQTHSTPLCFCAPRRGTMAAKTIVVSVESDTAKTPQNHTEDPRVSDTMSRTSSKRSDISPVNIFVTRLEHKFHFALESE